MAKLTCCLLMLAAAAVAGPADVPVTFQLTTNTTFGESVYVVGSIPQLLNWDYTHAIKLVPSHCVASTCDWSAPVGIREGTGYEYKFITRDDCATCLSNSGNVRWQGGANRTGATPAGPLAPSAAKTVFYYSGWTSVSLLYSNTATSNFVLQAMTPVSNGLWRADGINRAGETNLVFVFTDNLGSYDNPDNIAGRNYETPLDAFVVRSGQVYNYWPPATVSTNRVETFSIPSTNGVQSRTIRVYLPRGYNENTAKRYPVLYLQDGQNLFLGMGGANGNSWNADTNANNLIRFGKMRETILVGIDNTTDRQCEYTPCTNCVNGVTADKYAAFLIQEVKPQIDATYRTLSDAENTGVLGSSRGGLISAYLGWEHSDVFHRIGGLSPSFWACASVLNSLTNAPHRPIRVYLDSGDTGDFSICTPCYDGILTTLTARDNLIRNGFALNLDLDHTIGYAQNHDEYWWDRRSPRVYTFLFPTSDEPNTILDAATPPRITSLQLAGSSNVVTWTSYRLRTYSLEGSTNEAFDSSMTWSNLLTTLPEARLWNYPSVAVTNAFRYFRIHELAVPNWPN